MRATGSVGIGLAIAALFLFASCRQSEREAIPVAGTPASGAPIHLPSPGSIPGSTGCAADEIGPLASGAINMVSWNIESGGADERVIAGQMATLGPVDLWGLSEVNGVRVVPILEAGIELSTTVDYASIVGSSGGGDRLLVLYNADCFDYLGHEELTAINIEGRVRAPLVVRLSHRATGTEFLFVVNHLYRSKDDQRHLQARLLNQWAAPQTLPIVAVGDYNFDWDIGNGCEDHDQGFDNLVDQGRFAWLRPDPLVRTQCSANADGVGDDACTFASVLDFVFVAGPARSWPAESDVVVTQNDFPDDEKTSDHRPVSAWIGLSGSQSASTVNRATDLYRMPGTPLPPQSRAYAGQRLDLVGRDEENRWVQTHCGLWLQTEFIDNAPPPHELPIISALAPVVLNLLVNRGHDEVLALVNTAAAPVDIGGWYVNGSKGADLCTIPDDAILPPGASYHIATGASPLRVPGIKCTQESIWNNSGEVICLFTPTGTLVDHTNTGQSGERDRLACKAAH